jgi:hypothetical protein
MNIIITPQHHIYARHKDAMCDEIFELSIFMAVAFVFCTASRSVIHPPTAN